MNVKENPVIMGAVNEVTELCDPYAVYLVSHKTGADGAVKAFKLCVVISDDRDPERTESELLIKTDPPVPCDFIVYTLEEWDDCSQDDGSFAYRVENGGERLYVKEQ